MSLSRAAAAVLLAAFLVSLPGISATPAAGTSPHAPMTSAERLTAPPLRPWHQGSNQSTPLANLTYSQNVFLSTMPNNSSLSFGELAERMTLSYNDGTGSSIFLNFGYNFYPGGVDVQNQTVLNWSRMYWMGLAIGEYSVSNGSVLQPGVTFFGFDVVNETPQNVTFSKGTMDGGWTDWVPSNIVAALSYASADGMIGNVTLSTAPYEYQGAWLNESIATFDVTINSTISEFGVPGIPGQGPNVSLPTVLSFRFVHTLNQTTYTYGAEIDWGAVKDFPTRSPMSPGESYSLVEEDGLNLVRGNTGPRNNWTTITEFSTDPGNDTAFYSWNGSIVSKEYFTHNYTILGSSQPLNTTRIYMENATISNATQPNESAIFVIYGGFQYDESSGFSFDPEVQTPSAQSGGPSLFRAINVSPPNSQVSVGGKETLHAGTSCSPSPCPASTAYRWRLSSPLGTLSPATGATVAFTAGNSTGGTEINVTVSWNGINASASTEITVVPATVNQTLVGLGINMPSTSIQTGQNMVLRANTTCTGGPCPSGINYSWNTSNSLGSVQPNNVPDPSFLAGPNPGQVNITLEASYDSVILRAYASVQLLSTVNHTLVGLGISISNDNIRTGQTMGISANATCSGSCPSGINYSWNTSNSLGSVQPNNVPDPTFLAGQNPGLVNITLEASYDSVTLWANASVQILPSNLPSLNGLGISLVVPQVQVGHTIQMNATPTCNSGSCGTYITYAWSLNNTLGKLTPTNASSESFTAGTSPGAVQIHVRATLGGNTQAANVTIHITLNPVILLTSVAVLPASASVEGGGTLTLNATATCSPSPCPAGVVYAWTPDSVAMGTVSSQGGDSTTFTAGTVAGTWVLTVTAVWDGRASSAESTITITEKPTSIVSSGSGSTIYLIAGVAAVIVLAVAVALYLRRRGSYDPPATKGSGKPAKPVEKAKDIEEGESD